MLIRTTHTGSLPRPKDVLEALKQIDVTTELDEAIVIPAVKEVVRRQVETGINIVSDGEMGRRGFSVYVRSRLRGFDGAESYEFVPRDLVEFAGFGRRSMEDPSLRYTGAPSCTGEVSLIDGPRAAESDARRLADALREVNAEDADAGTVGCMTAASPGVVALYFRNAHYPDHEAYVQAVADAMRAEYRAIIDAGFLLQIDAPDLAMGRHVQFADSDIMSFRARMRENLAALNTATADIPPDRMRLHVCWGNYEGPHTHDVELREIVDLLLTARPTTLMLPFANPRHAHEWSVLREVGWPAEKALAAGVIDTSTNYVEHPDLIAERLLRIAEIVGPERLVASTDCGFGTFAGQARVHHAVAWAKLATLVDGARRARQAIEGGA